MLRFKLDEPQAGMSLLIYYSVRVNERPGEENLRRLAKQRQKLSPQVLRKQNGQKRSNFTDTKMALKPKKMFSLWKTFRRQLKRFKEWEKN